MDVIKQKLILSCLVSNRELLSLCCGIIKPSYFDPTLKKTVKFIQEYFTKYKDIPKLATIKAECGLTLDDAGKIERADILYVSSELEEFCRNRAVTEAILAGPELLDKGDFGKILEVLKGAISVGLQKDLGTIYFENPEERLRKQSSSNTKISTGIEELDAVFDGGISRQELLLLVAASGIGKSMNMLCIGKNLMKQGLNGIYFTLEMGEWIVSQRLDSMVTGMSKDMIAKDIAKAASLIENASENMGKFIIKRLPENRTTVNDLRSYIQQLEQSSGFRPDFIIVDYIDIMGSSSAVKIENMFLKDKSVIEEVRSLGFDYDCIMISASQLGRGSQEAERITQSHIQGGMSKINTADYVVAINQTDLMRSAGEIYYEILKSRNSNGVGSRLLLNWDPISLTVSSNKKSINNLTLNKKSKASILSTDGTVFDKSQDEGGVLGLMNY